MHTFVNNVAEDGGLSSNKVFYFYSYGTLAWTALQAIPLMAAPSLITALLAPETRDPTSKQSTNVKERCRLFSPLMPNPGLEVYFSRTTAFALLTIGVLTVLLTGSVPLTASLASGKSALTLTTSCETKGLTTDA